MVTHATFQRDLLIVLGAAIIVWIVVGFKVWRSQKRRFTKVPYLEDCCLIAAVILMLANFAYFFFTLCVPRRSEQDWKFKVIDTLQIAERSQLTWSFLGTICHCFIRLSLLIYVRRLYTAFPRARFLRHLIDAEIGFEIFSVTGGLLWGLIDITGISSKYMTAAQAIHMRNANLGPLVIVYTMGIVADTIFLMSPLGLVFFKLPGNGERQRWRVKRKKILQIVGIVIVALSTLSISVVRLVTIFDGLDHPERDLADVYAHVIILGLAENTLAILTSCLPSASTVLRWTYADRVRKTRKLRPGPFITGDSLTSSNMDELDNRLSFGKSDNVSHINVVTTNDAGLVDGNLVVHPDGEIHVEKRVEQVNEGVAHEVEDDEEDNFFDDLVASDHFFPLATPLKPRSNRRDP